MTRLKDAYHSGEESHLGNTGQVRKEVNTVTVQVMSAPVIYTVASQVPTRTALVIADCEDTLNVLGNCYSCNKPEHMKRDCLNQTQAQTSYNRGPERQFNCYNCDKHGHLARDCHLPKKNRGLGGLMTTETKMICQEMMVQCNKKPVDFQ